MALGMLPPFPGLVTWRWYFFLFSEFVANFSIASPLLHRTQRGSCGISAGLKQSLLEVSMQMENKSFAFLSPPRGIIMPFATHLHPLSHFVVIIPIFHPKKWWRIYSQQKEIIRVLQCIRVFPPLTFDLQDQPASHVDLSSCRFPPLPQHAF